MSFDPIETRYQLNLTLGKLFDAAKFAIELEPELKDADDINALIAKITELETTATALVKQ